MKFTVSSAELYSHLQIVAKIISNKSVQVIPVLDNILFELNGDHIQLASADLANRLTTTVAIQGEPAHGSFMVAHRPILEFLKELPDQPLTIEVKPEAGYSARMEYSNGHFEFTALNADSFPEDIDMTKEAHQIKLVASRILAGINATKFAASTDERRPIMTGVLMDFKEDALFYVASDGRYLVRYTDNTVKQNFTAQVCIPSNICSLLSGSLLPKEDGEVMISFDAKRIQITLTGYTLTARLLEGKFPNYNSVIPPSSPYDVTVNREALLYGSRRVASCASKASKLILLNIQDNKLKLQSKDLDFSIAGEETIPCSVNEAQHNIRIGFDSELLGQILGSMNAPEVTLSLADQTRAGIIRPSEELEGTETLSLLIPIKLLSDN